LSSIARAAPLTCFFGVTFVFTWALLPWAGASDSVGLLVSLVALCGPAVGAAVVASALGRSDSRALRARVFDWRVPMRWYLVALLLPLPITALRSGLEAAAAPGGTIGFQPVSPLGLVVFVLVAGEEIGWRGFALPRLMERFGPWPASTILGVVWAAWHLPLFYLEGMPQHGSPFAPYVAYTIALSLILTFLAQRTRGSVVIATAFHGAVNTFGFVNTAATPTLRGWTNAASYGVAAVLVGVIAWGVRRRA